MLCMGIMPFLKFLLLCFWVCFFFPFSILDRFFWIFVRVTSDKALTPKLFQPYYKSV